MLETGIIVFLAFWLLWIKLNIVTRLRVLSRPFLLDILVTTAVFLLYGGTGAGLMAASVAAIIMSVNISIARKWFGYIYRKNGELTYHVGRWNLTEKIHVALARTG
jgi:nitrate reductase gamma subunit